MKSCENLGIKKLIISGDSQLVIEQMKGRYKVKAPNLKKYNEEAKRIMTKFSDCSFIHVKREFNKIADELSNKALLKPIYKKISQEPRNSRNSILSISTLLKLPPLILFDDRSCLVRCRSSFDNETRI